MSFEVLEPGPCTLLVDGGRSNHRARGVPLGGAADRWSWMHGNAQVGNPPKAVALEFALVGPTLRALHDTTCAISGAPFAQSGTCFILSAGDVLKIGPTAAGMRGYLCVCGGFRGQVVLGSLTSLEPIKRGQIVECDQSSALPARSASEGESDQPSLALRAGEVQLRCFAGAQADWFDASDFVGQTFAVTPASNRMGLRLFSNPIARPSREMVSEPVCPGTVQVLNDGQCVILGVDAQTIGGYPKIAQVIAVDLDLLGQLRPGQRVRFRLVTVDDAERASQLLSF